MEYYVALDGEKVGPLSQIKLVEMLEDGRVTAENKVWHQGMDEWKPMSEVPSMASRLRRNEDLPPVEENQPPLPHPQPVEVPPPPRKTRVTVVHEVRPLTRFWARYFDYTMVAVLVVIFSDIEIPTVEPGVSPADLVTRYEEIFRSGELQELAKMQFWALLIWHGLEGILIHLFGTTPGKALFGIHIVTERGSKVSVINGIYRSFLVYILGVGLFYFSLITFAAMTFSFFRLMARGTTAWDQILRLRVEHPPLGLGRILLAIAAFITLMMLQVLSIS